MKFQPKRKLNYQAILGVERELIKRHYEHIDCTLLGGTLVCMGTFQPTSESEVYSYKIKYHPPKCPSVYVVHPEIEYNDDIHMFPRDNSLCLYHKSDLEWKSDSTHLYDTIIPWTHEWFVFYELYKLKGEWKHPFVPHNSQKVKD